MAGCSKPCPRYPLFSLCLIPLSGLRKIHCEDGLYTQVDLKEIKSGDEKSETRETASSNQWTRHLVRKLTPGKVSIGPDDSKPQA
ncbi:hypothetical protein H8959_019114 [Pygathrix nigripes]